MLASLDRSFDLGRALAAEGFDVFVVESISSMADVLGEGELFVAIVDGREPNWLRDVSDLVGLRPGSRPLALVGVEGPDEILAALSAGVAGFSATSADTDAVVRCVRSIFDSGVAIPRSMVPALVAAVRHGKGHRIDVPTGGVELTDREWEVLGLLMQRRSTREMAEMLYVSISTVRSHVSSLLDKLGALDREDLVRRVVRPEPGSAP